MSLAYDIGNIAAVTYLALAALALLGLIGMAAGPELLNAYQESRLVVRHGNRRRQAHRGDGPATTGIQVLDRLLAEATR